MGAMKNWMMDMEEYTFEAIMNGATTKEDVLAYVHTHLSNVDDNYIISVLNKYGGLDADDSDYYNQPIPEEVF